MIHRLQQYFAAVSTAFIDGLLYVMIALFGAGVASFTSEEAYKYINPYVLYWLTETSKWGLAAVTALKMFRSTSYADHQVTKAKADAPGPVP